jgi:hypothetical protein
VFRSSDTDQNCASVGRALPSARNVATLELPDTTSPTLAAAAAFRAVAVAAATAGSTGTFLSEALAQFESLLGESSCAIFSAGQDGGRYLAGVGLPSGYLTGLETTLLSPAAWSESPTSIADAQTLQTTAPQGALMRANGFQPCWSVPLTRADGRAVGVFVAYARGIEPPSTCTFELACFYGTMIALGLDAIAQDSGLAARYHVWSWR